MNLLLRSIFCIAIFSSLNVCASKLYNVVECEEKKNTTHRSVSLVKQAVEIGAKLNPFSEAAINTRVGLSTLYGENPANDPTVQIIKNACKKECGTDIDVYQSRDISEPKISLGGSAVWINPTLVSATKKQQKQIASNIAIAQKRYLPIVNIVVPGTMAAFLVKGLQFTLHSKNRGATKLSAPLQMALYFGAYKASGFAIKVATKVMSKAVEDATLGSAVNHVATTTFSDQCTVEKEEFESTRYDHS